MIYHLGLDGIRLMRQLDGYPPEELRKRYKDSSRQPDFIARCLLLADCCITLDAKSVDNVQYSFTLQADYANPKSEHHSLNELQPNLRFSKRDGETTTVYLREVFDATLPRYRVRNRLKGYVEYLTDESEQTISLLLFPNTAELIYAKRRVRKLLEDASDDENVAIRFTTTEKVKASGVTGMIWEEL